LPSLVVEKKKRLCHGKRQSWKALVVPATSSMPKPAAALPSFWRDSTFFVPERGGMRVVARGVRTKAYLHPFSLALLFAWKGRRRKERKKLRYLAR